MCSLSPATHYFKEYWEDLWSGVSANRDLLKSFNPRVVIQELLDEITFNKQGNKANEEFFRRTLGDYLKSDPASNKRLKMHLQMMLKEFDLFRHRPLYLPQLCKATLKVFENLEYFEDCLESFQELMDSPQLCADKKAKVRLIVNHLIVEFREIGYTDDEIKKFPEKIFSTIKYHDNKPFWNFPHLLRCNDWDNKLEVEQYGKSLEEYQSTLTEKNRIYALLTLAKAKKETLRFIFRVNGIVGNEELEVTDVFFYSPANKRLASDDSEIDPKKELELFGADESSKAINAAVIVDAISASSGITIARSKVEKALTLCRFVSNRETPLRLSNSYIALNKCGRIIASRSAYEGVSHDLLPAISLDNEWFKDNREQLEHIEETRKVAHINRWGRKFDEAGYWLRKAEESNSYVEKLLSYWICIETLCAKPDNHDINWFEVKGGQQKETDISLIREVVGKMRAVQKCYEHGWMVHEHIQWLLTSSINNKNYSALLGFISKAQLAPEAGEKVFLINFINCCNVIEKALPDGLLKDQVAELYDFYHDKNTALKVLKEHLKTTQDEIALIYRMRNKIAHDGSSAHPLLPSLCKLAADYAFSLFFRIGYYVISKKEVDLASILITAVQDYDRIEMRLKVEDPKEVLLKQ